MTDSALYARTDSIGAGAPDVFSPALDFPACLEIATAAASDPSQQRRDLLPMEILEAAAEIADGSDVLGLERSRLEHLVRVVIEMDRQRRDKSQPLPLHLPDGKEGLLGAIPPVSI